VLTLIRILKAKMLEITLVNV